MPKTAIAAICLMCAVTGAWAAAPSQPADADAVVDLWPGVAPGSENWTREETVTQFEFAGRSVAVTRNVVTPTLTVYLPDAAKATGAGAIIAPGGAFRHVTMDSEGYDVARWLAEHGVAGFVLKYRVVETPADDAEYKAALDALLSGIREPAGTKEPGARRAMRGEEMKHALADAVRALELVHVRAKEWRVDPAQVGMIGFSAGAGLTAAVLLAADLPKLAFAAPIYGAPLGPTLPQLPETLPPVFLAVAQDDLLVRPAVMRFNEALQAGGYDSELHAYSSGGHGFGMFEQGATSDRWIDQLFWWLQVKGFTEDAP